MKMVTLVLAKPRKNRQPCFWGVPGVPFSGDGWWNPQWRSVFFAGTDSHLAHSLWESRGAGMESPFTSCHTGMSQNWWPQKWMVDTQKMTKIYQHVWSASEFWPVTSLTAKSIFCCWIIVQPQSSPTSGWFNAFTTALSGLLHCIWRCCQILSHTTQNSQLFLSWSVCLVQQGQHLDTCCSEIRWSEMQMRTRVWPTF